MEILDYKKRLVDAETKYRQHQSLFEAVRTERNLCNRSLVEAQEEVRDLKSKLKTTSQQIEQLKEDIAMKEANLVKEEFCKLFQFNILNSMLVDPFQISNYLLILRNNKYKLLFFII